MEKKSMGWKTPKADRNIEMAQKGTNVNKKSKRSKFAVSQDSKIKAKKPGWRVSKDGNKYYEVRENRSDSVRNKKPYLKNGGGVGENKVKANAWLIREVDGLPKIKAYATIQEAKYNQFDEMADEGGNATLIKSFEGLKSYLDKQYGIDNMTPYIYVKKYSNGGGLGEETKIVFNKNRDWRLKEKYSLYKGDKEIREDSSPIELFNWAKEKGYIIKNADEFDIIVNAISPRELEKNIGKYAKGGGVGESGLYVTGRTQVDNNAIGDVIEEEGYYAEWNPREGYWFFPEEVDMYDDLESELDKAFVKKGINARFEGVFAKGGNLYAKEDKEMLHSQTNQIKHHTAEMESVIDKQKHIEPWVVSKMGRATSDLSDVTHYLDGRSKMAKGGGVGDIDSNIHIAWDTNKKITDDIRSFIFDSYEAAGQELADDVINAIKLGIEQAQMDMR